MAECVDCLQEVKGAERGFSFCSPTGFACLCRTCGARYRTIDAVFARLRDAVLRQGAAAPGRGGSTSAA